MEEEKQPRPEQGYWAVIPADVLEDRDLSSSAKLFYAKLSALARKSGYCWASNEYLSELCCAGCRTVTSWIAELERKHYIRVETRKTQSGTDRRIYVGIFALAETCQCGWQKSARANNVDNNNINNPPKAPQGGRRGSRTRTARTQPDYAPKWFDWFWMTYPKARRLDKQLAMDEWDRLRPDRETFLAIARGLAALKQTDDWQRGVGIKYPGRFLRCRQWEEADLTAARPEPEETDVTGGMKVL